MAAWAALLLATLAAACSSREPLTGLPPGTRVDAPGAGDDWNTGDGSGPPGADASGLCGNEITSAVANAPNIYFVLDASGSMAATTSSGSTRFARVRGAAVGLVRDLGPLINVGAAVFPRGAGDSCDAGEQVFPVTPGDPYTGKDGPTTVGFKEATQIGEPFGGTPTSATLAGLYPTLTALTGQTIVLLATDGGPNCNDDAACSKGECIANLEEADACDPDVNCCAEGGLYGPGMCIDKEATVSEVKALADAGIKVYVIGIPGSEGYKGALDAMAVAGGAPQPGAHAYYSVSDLDDLGAVLGGIASVVIACELTLAAAPPDPGLTNVYLDQEALPYDAEDGWQWKAEDVVELVGEACDRLKHGQVKQVQIASGCPTEGAK